MSQVLTQKQQYWSAKLAEAEQAGQSLAEYARLHNVPVKKLYQWRSTLKSTVTASVTEQTRFTRVVSTTDMSSPNMMIHIPGARIQFSSLPDPQRVSELLRQCSDNA